MSLAIFDLDNTLLAGDSDYEWGQFLVKQGIVEAQSYEQANRRFYEQYKSGTLDIQEFARFAFKPLKDNELDALLRWRDSFMEFHIRPIILPQARELLNTHRRQGDTLMIITATNRFVTEPIARELGVEHLLATDPEIKDGRYTGEIDGVPCFQEGKVSRLQDWLAEQGRDLEDSWFYSDSHNDIPLLEKVSHPVAVDADVTLSEHALKRGWRQMSLRF